jgi:uncharacterized repeat protein (TIGR03803 family)
MGTVYMNESPVGKGGMIVRQEYSHHTGRIWHAALALSSVVMFALSASTAEAQMQSSYTILHNFDCSRYANYQYGVEGCNEEAPNFLAQGRDGNLYGTAADGGSLGSSPSNFREGAGTIFNINPNVSQFPFTPLYTFDPMTSDGKEPKSGLIIGMDGKFYGTARQGGASKQGSVFRFDGSGFSPLYPFGNGMDGAFPEAPPVQAPDGNLYGVTNGGTNKGVIYRITPTTGFSVIATLGVATTAPLVLGFDGNLYGTTQSGSVNTQNIFSTNGGGTIFRIPMGGAVQPTFLHTFNSMNKVVDAATGQMVSDGSVPKGPVVFGQDGNLYGTTSAGGSASQGVIYQLNPNTVTYKILHTLPVSTMNNVTTAPDGSGSESGLVQGSDGFLFGVAAGGGKNGLGTLFKLDTAGGNFVVLWSFGNPIQCPNNVMANDGSNPASTPTLHTNGKIYGMTPTGGCRKTYGTLYSFDAGLKPFASIVGGSRWVNVGSRVGVIGQGFISSTGVLLGSSTPLTGKLAVQVFSDTYMEVTVPQLIAPSPITILMPSGNLVTPQVVTTSAPQCGTVMFGCRKLPSVPFTPR